MSKHHPSLDQETKRLRRQAIALLERQRREEPSDSEARETFRRRSDAHCAALAWAEARFDLLEQIPVREFSRAEKYLIQRQAARARLTEPRRVVPAMAIFLAVGVALFWTVVQDRGSPTRSASVASVDSASFDTRRSHREVTLADGSTVWLDWNTSMRVDISDTERRVVLAGGRVSFAVIPDPNRPFTVDASGLSTRVTGTEFTVDARRDRAPSVAVLEGSVRVESLVGTIELRAKERATLQGDTLNRQRDRGDTRGDLAWRDGRIILRDLALASAFRKLEPYSSFRIDVSGIEAMDARISGTYFTERADDALQGLIQTHRLQVQQDRRRLVLTPPKLERPSLPGRG